MELNGCSTRTAKQEKGADSQAGKARDDGSGNDSSCNDKETKQGSKSEKKRSRSGGDRQDQDNSDSRSDQSLPTVKSIAENVAELRGLPLTNQIEFSYISQDELQARIEKEFSEEYPVAEVEGEEKALQALDLIEPGFDLLEAMEQLLVDQIIGYYDDETKQLALVSEREELDAMNEVTLAHEITHALQDQSFSLGNLYPLQGAATADANYARLALVEGDASLAMTEYAEAELSLLDLIGLGFSARGSYDSLSDIPSYLDDSLMFPYIAGEEFVSYVKEKGGWELVNALYAFPPESTEQIIHPEKYFEGDHPVNVELPDLLPLAGAGWDPVYNDSFGEFDVRQLLSNGLSYRQSSAAAAGWDGGRYNVYERSDGAIMAVILLAWDSEEEAREFTMAMSAYLEEFYCNSFEFEPRQFPLLESCYGDFWVMVEKDNLVMFARAPDKTLANLLPATILGVQPRVAGVSSIVQTSCGPADIEALFRFPESQDQ